MRSIMSLDVEDLASWVPGSEEWSVGVRIMAGPADGPGEESFDLTICSVDWIAAQVGRDGVFDGRHCLVASGFTWHVLSSYIERRVRQCEGMAWPDVAERLSRFAYWEFEDYQP